MKRLLIANGLLVMFVAFNAFAAEPKRPPTTLMPPAFPPSPFGFNKGDVKRGESIYEQNGCPSCHVIGGKGGKSGPDLSRVGESRTTPDAFRPYLANNHKPPVILMQQDMDDLSAYLQNLKLFR